MTKTKNSKRSKSKKSQKQIIEEVKQLEEQIAPDDDDDVVDADDADVLHPEQTELMAKEVVKTLIERGGSGVLPSAQELATEDDKNDVGGVGLEFLKVGTDKLLADRRSLQASSDAVRKFAADRFSRVFTRNSGGHLMQHSDLQDYNADEKTHKRQFKGRLATDIKEHDLEEQLISDTLKHGSYNQLRSSLLDSDNDADDGQQQGPSIFRTIADKVASATDSDTARMNRSRSEHARTIVPAAGGIFAENLAAGEGVNLRSSNITYADSAAKDINRALIDRLSPEGAHGLLEQLAADRTSSLFANMSSSQFHKLLTENQRAMLSGHLPLSAVAPSALHPHARDSEEEQKTAESIRKRADNLLAHFSRHADKPLTITSMYGITAASPSTQVMGGLYSSGQASGASADFRSSIPKTSATEQQATQGRLAVALAAMQERAKHTLTTSSSHQPELFTGKEFDFVGTLRREVNSLQDAYGKTYMLYELAHLVQDMKNHNTAGEKTLKEAAEAEAAQVRENVRRAEQYVHNVIAHILSNENIDPRQLSKPRFAGMSRPAIVPQGVPQPSAATAGGLHDPLFRRYDMRGLRRPATAMQIARQGLEQRERGNLINDDGESLANQIQRRYIDAALEESLQKSRGVIDLEKKIQQRRILNRTVGGFTQLLMDRANLEQYATKAINRIIDTAERRDVYGRRAALLGQGPARSWDNPDQAHLRGRVPLLRKEEVQGLTVASAAQKILGKRPRNKYAKDVFKQPASKRVRKSKQPPAGTTVAAAAGMQQKKKQQAAAKVAEQDM